MAELRKSSFKEDLDKYQVFISDTEPDSKYFKITELPDTFTGGKNAFLIAGSEFLVPDTLVKIEIKDSVGNVIYSEPGEGIVSSSVNGEAVVTEYYEGISKVVAVYIYPDTTYGPCTITILGEASSYDNNGIITPVPVNWQGAYNVKWQKQINVNPALPNTTKIRFYRRPQANITEILSPIYRIESGSKVNSGVSQSFAEIKLSNMETFAGDVKRVKVFRTSQGDISDYDLIQDILVESKELLTSYNLSGSVVGQTGIFTSETLQNFWNTGSLKAELTSSRVESGLKLSGSGYFTYTSSLDIKSNNTYELNLDAFYSSSTSSNLGIYLSQVTTSMENNVEIPIVISSSIATLVGTQPTKNLLDTTIPFKLDRNYPTASLYFSQSRGEWHLGNISLKLSQETAFSPDEISFVTTMPTIIGDETYNFKFEFYDVNNNYVPVFVTGSGTFTGGNTGQLLRSLTFDSDRTAFRFSTGSFGNPPFQQLGFKISKQNLTGSVSYGRSVFDTSGNYISPASYPGTYPGTLTNASDAGATLTIANFSGSVASVLVGSIVYTASCDGIDQFETIYRFEDGDNAPGVFVTANTNQFIYKATDLSLNPTGQVITIEAKRKNLASATTTLTVNSGSGKPGLNYVSTNSTTGVDTYTLAGSSYPYSTGETIYYISGSDQFGNEFSDSIKISPVKILDGFSVAVTNENTSFPATSTGTVVGGFAASSGSITVKVGNEDISYASPIANNKFSASISSTSNLTANTFNGTSYSINALSADSGSLTLLVKYQDGGGTIISSSKQITYSKVKKAAPVLDFVIGNNNQSVTAKSTGAQIDAFLTASFNVLETYDGVVSSKSLTITKINTTNSYATGSTTSTTLALPSMANGTDSVDISITGSVVDSETTTRNVFGNISLSKVKKAQPTITFSITPQAQTVAADSTGTLTGTIVDPILSAFEGSSALTYNNGTLTNSQYKITSVTGVTVASQTPNTSTIDVTAIAADDNTGVVGISYVDSEGTSGTSTIKFLISKARRGTAGANGADGGVGPGVVYRGDWAPNTIYYSSSIRVDVVKGSNSQYYYAKTGHTSSADGALDKPITGTSYTTYWNPFGATFSSVATDILLAQDATITRGLVMGTYGVSDKGFIRSANASALMTGKGYYLDTTGSMRFGDPAGAHVKFTESEGLIISGNVIIDGGATVGGTTLTVVRSGAASGATAQQNNSAKTAGSVGGWTVNSNAIYRGTEGTDDTFTTNAGDITFGAGFISAKEFKISSTGAATFKGTLSAAAGTFTGALNGGTISIGSGNSIFKADSNGIYLGNATFASAPFRVTPGGALTATNATISGTITVTGGNAATTTDLSDGLATKYDASNPSGFQNNTSAKTGGSVGGWSIDANRIFNTNVDIDNANSRIDFKSGGVVKTRITKDNVNIGSTATTTVTIPSQDPVTAVYTGTTSGANDRTLTVSQTVSEYAITTPAGVTGNKLSIKIPNYGMGSLGSFTLVTVGNGTSYQYGYKAYITYKISSAPGGAGDIANSTYYFYNGFNNDISVGTTTGTYNLPGISAGSVPIYSGTATAGQVFYISTTYYVEVLTRGNAPSGFPPPTLTGTWYATAAGWTQISSAAILVAVANRAEYGANGVQIGTNDGNYAAMGDAAGSGLSGLFNGGVQIFGTLTAALASSSDRRAKTNIKPLQNATDTLKKLNPVSFDWLQHQTNVNEFSSSYGFIADEVEEILPNMVMKRAGLQYDDFKYLDYNSFHALAIKAILELTDKVEKLEAKISGSI